MRTQVKRGFFKHLKSLSLVAITAALLVGCGKNNTSGKSSSSTSAYGYAGYGTSYTTSYGTYTLEQMASVVANENPCYEGGTRSRAQVPLSSMNVNSGSSYIGVSSYGDMAVVYNNGSQGVIDLYICPRAAANGQGQLSSTPIVNIAENCAVGEISAAQMVLGTNYGQYLTVNFRPIYYGRGSSLCRTTGY